MSLRGPSHASAGSDRMNVEYRGKTDLLYIRLDERKQTLLNRRVSDDVVLDIGAGDKIVGIEILNVSKNLSLDKIVPVNIERVG